MCCFFSHEEVNHLLVTIFLPYTIAVEEDTTSTSTTMSATSSTTAATTSAAKSSLVLKTGLKKEIPSGHTRDQTDGYQGHEVHSMVFDESGDPEVPGYPYQRHPGWWHIGPCQVLWNAISNAGMLVLWRQGWLLLAPLIQLAVVGCCWVLQRSWLVLMLLWSFICCMSWLCFAVVKITVPGFACKCMLLRVWWTPQIYSLIRSIWIMG